MFFKNSMEISIIFKLLFLWGDVVFLFLLKYFSLDGNLWAGLLQAGAALSASILTPASGGPCCAQAGLTSALHCLPPRWAQRAPTRAEEPLRGAEGHSPTARWACGTVL